MSVQPVTKAVDQDYSRISTERVDSNTDRAQNEKVSTIHTSKYLKGSKSDLKTI